MSDPGLCPVCGGEADAAKRLQTMDRVERVIRELLEYGLHETVKKVKNWRHLP